MKINTYSYYRYRSVLNPHGIVIISMKQRDLIRKIYKHGYRGNWIKYYYYSTTCITLRYGKKVAYMNINISSWFLKFGIENEN